MESSWKKTKNVVFSDVALSDSLWLQQRNMYSIKFTHCCFAYVQIAWLWLLEMRKNLSSVFWFFIIFKFHGGCSGERCHLT